MTEQERDAADAPEELDPEVEAHLLKETLAAGAAAAAMFAGTSAASANWMPTPGAGGAVVDPGPGAGGNAVVDPGPGGAGGGVVDPGPGGAGSAVVIPDAVDRAVAARQAAKEASAKKASAKKSAAATQRKAGKPPLEP